MTAPVPIVRPNDPEWLARKRLIDPRLEAAGWTVVPYDPARPLESCDGLAIEEYPTANGPADYALCVGGRILGIVEAKKVAVGARGRLTQAERYSRGVLDSPLDFRGYRVPFLSATNGTSVYYHDVRHPLECSREIQGFHTPGALTELMGRDVEAAHAELSALPNRHRQLRPYQREANAAIEAAIAARKRKMLVAMATGTGKTFTMVNQVYRLMKWGVARRVLFLVDRRALAAQAVRAFASFDAEPGFKFNQLYEVYSQGVTRAGEDDEGFNPKKLPDGYLENPPSGAAFVYVCTVQRMAINLFGRDAAARVGATSRRACCWSGSGSSGV